MFIILELRKDFFKNINVQQEKRKGKQRLEKLFSLPSSQWDTYQNSEILFPSHQIFRNYYT